MKPNVLGCPYHPSKQKKLYNKWYHSYRRGLRDEELTKAIRQFALENDLDDTIVSPKVEARKEQELNQPWQKKRPKTLLPKDQLLPILEEFYNLKISPGRSAILDMSTGNVVIEKWL